MENRDEKWLREEKYAGKDTAAYQADLARLAAGEPLAYIIGNVPFLGITVHLDSRPLIPRPETEWWTEKLIAHVRERIAATAVDRQVKTTPEHIHDDASITDTTYQPFRILDLCAGSGAIGLAVLAKIPEAQVTFAELESIHADTIRKNIETNVLDASRATIVTGDLFAPLPSARFDIIATNPPYIPESRNLDSSVTNHEPHKALFSGSDGLALIRRIATDAPQHLNPDGELWVEVDSERGEEARALLAATGFRANLIPDQYGRPRLVVGYL